jgi:integrase
MATDLSGGLASGTVQRIISDCRGYWAYLHSLRGTVITMLERAGVPEPIVQDIVGHERSTLTGSTYSGKSTFEAKAGAIEKLTYPHRHK